MPPRPAATISNRRARYEYEVLESYEAGIMLEGAEVKSIREGKANLADAYARVDHGEIFLHAMYVAPYQFSSDELDPSRKRKLLLHHKEIDEITRASAERGMTLVPLKLYFKDGRVKIEIAVAKGKRSYDKRQSIKERDAKRETQRALKGDRESG